MCGIARAIIGAQDPNTVQDIARAVRNVHGAAFLDAGSRDVGMDVVKRSMWTLGLDRVGDERYPTVVSLMDLLPEEPPELVRNGESEWGAEEMDRGWDLSEGYYYHMGSTR
jgi:hypothetical protein